MVKQWDFWFLILTQCLFTIDFIAVLYYASMVLEWTTVVSFKDGAPCTPYSKSRWSTTSDSFWIDVNISNDSPSYWQERIYLFLFVFTIKFSQVNINLPSFSNLECSIKYWVSIISMTEQRFYKSISSSAGYATNGNCIFELFPIFSAKQSVDDFMNQAITTNCYYPIELTRLEVSINNFISMILILCVLNSHFNMRFLKHRPRYCPVSSSSTCSPEWIDQNKNFPFLWLTMLLIRLTFYSP